MLETAREADPLWLGFLKWLIETKRLESSRTDDGDACRCYRCIVPLKQTRR